MNKIRTYLSHPIRGLKNDNATQEDIDKNNDKAKFFGDILRLAFPNLDLHIPAEMESFVGRAYKLGIITEQQILTVDCNIIEDCDLVIFYDHQRGFSNGMKREKNYAKSNGILYTTVHSLNDETLFRIRNIMEITNGYKT